MAPPIQPQPRHLDAAKKLTDGECRFITGHRSRPCNYPDCCSVCRSRRPIALALAEAENRAAWDGREFGSRETGHHLCGSPAECAEVYREFVAKYGPRLTKENQL